MVVVAKLTGALIYLTAFFDVVVVNCITHPENWDSCMQFNTYLIPGIQEGWEMLTKPCPYCDEQNALQERRDLQTD